MKRITFLIGNGFDINVGLNTRYEEFYEYYIKECPNDLLACLIKRDFKRWSDLEIALGEYTAQVRTEKECEFWESEQTLERQLVEYLEGQMKRITWEGNKKRDAIADEMRKSLSSFYQELSVNEANYIADFISYINEPIEYSFISFNYTDVLNNCVNIAKTIIENRVSIRMPTFRSCGYRDILGKPLYIHGTVSGEVILGVNDAWQIANKAFRRDAKYFVKKEINEDVAPNRIPEARKMIDESIIVCIFGMSIGETDKMWWEYLGQWLQFNSRRRLIIYSKKPKGKVTTRQIQENREEIIRRLMQNADNVMWTGLTKQIYTVFNKKMFDFKLL